MTTALQCINSQKPYTMAGVEPRIFCFVGGRDDHYATPPVVLFPWTAHQTFNGFFLILFQLRFCQELLPHPSAQVREPALHERRPLRGRVEPVRLRLLRHRIHRAHVRKR
jgi:hypothetical protein